MTNYTKILLLFLLSYMEDLHFIRLTIFMSSLIFITLA